LGEGYEIERKRMNLKCLSAVSLTLLLASCGPSAEEKARIRQVVTAYNAASYSHADNSDALLAELQKTVDVVPDGKERDEILRCQHLLTMYTLQQKLQFLALERNLRAIGHGQNSTKKDFDIANAKAQKEVPLPDYNPIASCAVGTLPALAK
jgi:hypothetical protein